MESQCCEIAFFSPAPKISDSTFDVLLNLKRASLQAPKLYSLDHPDLDTLLAPGLSELHFPKSADAPSKLLKLLASFSLELLCELSRLPVERQPSPTNLWRIVEARDLEMNCWVARALLQGSFSGSEANSVVAPEMKKPIRQAEQTFMLLEAHDAAEVADGNRQPVLYLPPDEAAREVLRCHLVRTETFAFMNCLNVRPFQIRKGKVRLPAFTEMLGELGCPFDRMNETDVGWACHNSSHNLPRALWIAPSLNWNGNQSYRTRWAPTALHTSEGVADIETPKLDRYIGVWIPSTTHHTTGFRRRVRPRWGSPGTREERRTHSPSNATRSWLNRRALHCSAGDPGFDPGRARSPFFRLRVVSSPTYGDGAHRSRLPGRARSELWRN
ncbi:hypothetical protein PAPYR_12280 [Paratrimastix pyriformis]|uniref:Uncharacterized protein n=1 Tax=Paratrimastix pyriformis TaxID=342808 RepID=A0ABQ8U252_9EUKA|nr:hypothetical protein PAPYR_12280 [Paratrimastix pyriformis]